MLISSRFAEIERRYLGLVEPTMEERVHYERAKMDEKVRKERLSRREAFEKRQLAAEGDTGDADTRAEISGSEVPLTGAAHNPQGKKVSRAKPVTQGPGGKGRAKRKKQNRFSAEEKRKSQSYGLEAARSHTQKGRKHRTGESSAGPKKRAKLPAGKIARRLAKQPFDFDDLMSGDVVASAHASAMEPEGPRMTGKNKQKALAQLVASLPASDQAAAKSDRKLIEDASRQFTSSAKSDDLGGWKIKGLKTSLLHYQVGSPVLTTS